MLKTAFEQGFAAAFEKFAARPRNRGGRRPAVAPTAAAPPTVPPAVAAPPAAGPVKPQPTVTLGPDAPPPAVTGNRPRTVAGTIGESAAAQAVAPAAQAASPAAANGGFWRGQGQGYKDLGSSLWSGVKGQGFGGFGSALGQVAPTLLPAGLLAAGAIGHATADKDDARLGPLGLRWHGF